MQRDLNANDLLYFACRIVLLVVVILVGLWFGLDTAKEPRRFISVLGMFVYVGISYAFSLHRRKVSVLTHSDS